MARLNELDAKTFQARLLAPYVARGLLFRLNLKGAITGLEPGELDALKSVLDTKAPSISDIAWLDGIRDQGDGVLRLEVIGKDTFVVLDPEVIAVVLERSPDDFGPSQSKFRALAPFMEKGVVISVPPEYKKRQKANRETLGFDQPVHPRASHYMSIVADSVAHVNASRRDEFIDVGFVFELGERIMLQVIFGAVDDELHALVRRLEQVLVKANTLSPLATAVPKLAEFGAELDPGLVSSYIRELRQQYRKARPGSLAEHLRKFSELGDDEQLSQLPQWMFAMKEGIALHTLYVLALLAGHPEHMNRVRREVNATDLDDENQVAGANLEYLQRCIQETMRLWTVVPFLYRSAREDFKLRVGGREVDVPKGADVLIHNPVSNRDRGHPNRHHFDPERWPRADVVPPPNLNPPVNHLSNGVQICAARDFVMMLLKTTIARLLEAHEYKDATPRFPAGEPVPLFDKPYEMHVTRQAPAKGRRLEPAPEDEPFDYLIVGSGAGGGPLAANLAWEGYRVCLIDAGDDYSELADLDTSANYQVPAFHAKASEDRQMRWDFEVDGDRRRYYPRAGTLGGCSAHNALVTVRAPNADWSRLSKLLDDPSWSPKEMARHMEAVERCQYAQENSSSQHGTNGWLSTSLVDFETILRVAAIPSEGSFVPPILKILLAALIKHFGAKEVARILEKAPDKTTQIVEQLVNQDPVQNFFEQGSGFLRDLVSDPPTSPQQAVASFLKLGPDELLATVTQNLGTVRFIIEELIKPFGGDPNDLSREMEPGIYYLPLCTSNERRDGPREYVKRTQAMCPGNLVVLTNTLVQKVVLEDDDGGVKKKATGVECVKGKRIYRADRDESNLEPDGPAGPPKRINAKREVILCSGAFNTPQLLMLSGIGPEDKLGPHGIPIEVRLDGVGENLQDRYEASVVSRMKGEFEFLGDLKFERDDDPGYAEWEQRRGPYTTNGGLIASLQKSREANDDLPDLLIFGSPSDFRGYVHGYSEMIAEAKDLFTWVVLKAYSRNSAGTVTLREQDPMTPPVIDFRNFAQGGAQDIAALKEGIEFARGVMKLVSDVEEVLVPSRSQSDGDLETHIREVAWGHHACGTCKMGPADDPMAVLDSKFRVRSVRNLRVVDASVFPFIPGYFIFLPLYAVSQKASEVIAKAGRGDDATDWPTAP